MRSEKQNNRIGTALPAFSAAGHRSRPRSWRETAAFIAIGKVSTAEEVP